MHDDSPDDDTKLFRREMRGVKPLKPGNRARQDIARRPLQLNRNNTVVALADVFSDAMPSEDCPEVLEFARSGVQPDTLKKLRQGKLNIEQDIDLHGMTVADASVYLRQFLGECEAAGTRIIRIVHGKGYRSPGAPVIKAMVNRWLRELPMVLAFHSAVPAQGGTGAVVVLLKK